MVKLFTQMTNFTKQDIHNNIPEIFEKVVNKYGEKTAIATPETSINYKQLNRQANILARNILSHSSLKQKPILLLFEQGIDVFVSMLAVLKSNNIFVVLDPCFPEKRLNQIVDNSRSQLIITNSKNLELAKYFFSDPHSDGYKRMVQTTNWSGGLISRGKKRNALLIKKNRALKNLLELELK